MATILWIDLGHSVMDLIGILCMMDLTVPPRILIHQYFILKLRQKKLNTDSEKSDHYTANYSDLAMKK